MAINAKISIFAPKSILMRYLDPKNDLTFKKVFGEHPHLLKSFLNALLPLPQGEYIESLEYLPIELVPQIPLHKYSIVDVRCIDNKGRQFIVEMQMLWTDSFKQRVMFNATKAYVRQLDKAEKYELLQPVYALSLVNEIFEPYLKEYYHHYRIVHTEYNDKQLEGLEFVFVELPKFKAQNLTEQKLQVLWLRYLTEIKDGTVNIDDALLQNPEIREALDYIQESAFTLAELESYDKYWDSIRSEKSLLQGAEDRGMEKGRIEGKIEVARELIKKGITLDIIIDVTGLSKSQLEKISPQG